MSKYDAGYDGYKLGVLVGYMVTAQEAVNKAEAIVGVRLGYDHPLTAAIRLAGEQIAECRRLEGPVAGDAMAGQLERIS